MLLRLALAGLICAPAAAQATWTVDDNGPADFASVQVAVDTVAPGDVLLIESGNYGIVDVTKPLALLGNPSGLAPKFTSLKFTSIARFDASHLETKSLSVNGVPGRARLDDIRSTSSQSSISGAADLVITRSSFKTQTYIGLGMPALSIDSSGWVQIVDCEIFGGHGLADFSTNGLGEYALSIFGTQVLIVGSTVIGGNGQDEPFGPALGKGGTGIQLNSGTLEVRGSSSDMIRGGYQNPSGASLDGPAISVGGFPTGSSAIVSGVTTDGALLGNILLVAPRPYLELSGASNPGGIRQLDLFGLPGSLALTFLAASPTLDPSFEATLGLPLWIDPTTIVLTLAIPLAGQDTPTSLPFTLPTSPPLTGLSLTLQAVVVDPFGGLMATNAAAELFSF